MANLIKFESDETDGYVHYINPDHVVALVEDGDTHTTVFLLGSHEFSVFGGIETVKAALGLSKVDLYG